MCKANVNTFAAININNTNYSAAIYLLLITFTHACAFPLIFFVRPAVRVQRVLDVYSAMYHFYPPIAVFLYPKSQQAEDTIFQKILFQLFRTL